MKRPTLPQIVSVFAPVDRIIIELERDGTINVNAQGVPVFLDGGEWHEVCPALNGWIELWDRMIAKYSIHLDLEPLRKLHKKLLYASPLLENDVSSAKATISQCRKLYRGMDCDAVASVARTQQVSIALSGCKT